MPFGLDLKSLVIGALIALYIFPWIMGFVSNRQSKAAA